MTGWKENPATGITQVFSEIARSRMAGLPLNNPALQVEAVGFSQAGETPWAGVLITPWGINLLCLPAHGTPWPATPAGGRHSWHFASGDYEFIVAHDPVLGSYHLCSLFSPALDFTSQAEARLAAQAALDALHQAPPAPPKIAPRRHFLGLGKKSARNEA